MNPLVLEIGGGHNPYPQSDVIVDKYLDNKERAGNLKMDRPVVIADFQALPFKDKSFSKAICSHVLEHVEDVEQALAELARVAAGGYLETPSAITELVEPHREYHRWYVAKKGSKLVFYPKQSGSAPRQSLLNRLLTDNLSFKFFFVSNPDVQSTRLNWRGKIECEVMPAGTPLDLEALYPRLDQSISGFLSGLLGHYLGKARRKIGERARARKAPAEIDSLLCCPACKTSLRIDGDKMHCSRCRGHYRKQGRLYFLLRENLIPD